MESRHSFKNNLHYLKILLPTFITISLFIIALFVIVIPQFENIIIDRKREMIHELTNTAVSMIDKWHKLEIAGEKSRTEAQESAISQIRGLRYGDELKDYFWITDMHPTMIVHPYRPDLDAKDLSGFKDSHGKKLFVEMCDTVRRSGEGYVDYTWQWKDDSTKIVPKLSHVKEFKPWGWIIGTGIYIEDVKEEIASLEQKVITISIVISIISAILLLYIAFQNLRSERLRKVAEDELRESREKYKMLVETSGEGLIMILENRQVYFNKTLYSILDYKEMNRELHLEDVFPKYPESKIFEFANFKKINHDESNVEQVETKLRKQNGEFLDVLLIISPISLMNNDGVILSVKDISLHKEIEEELDYSKEKYLALTNQLTIGVFRVTPDKNLFFTEINPAMLNLLGVAGREELLSVSLSHFCENSDEGENLVTELMTNEFIKNRIVQIKQGSGKKIAASISAVLVKNSDGNYLSIDGIMEDITEQRKTDKDKEELISNLQTSVFMLNQTIKPFIKMLPWCNIKDTITDAVTKMTAANSSAILVKGTDDEEIGIITDSDIRERVVLKTADLKAPVYSFMTSPLTSINVSSTVYDALIEFRKNKLSQIIVKDFNNKAAGVLFADDIFNASNTNYLFLIQNIESSDSVKLITECRNQLLLLIKGLIESDTSVRSVTKIISMISDSVTKRIIELAINEFGTPPVKFTFLTMGSEGREEQTLSTDQDNAIIYEDVLPDREKETQEYFLKLGNRISDDLNSAGYRYCKGNIMAKNIKWCQPFSDWKKYFTDWITTSDPQDLLDVKIFFDFRNVYGDGQLSSRLKEHVDKVTGGYSVFFVYLSESLLQTEIPDGMLKLKAPLDIKLALLPIVDFARLYGLKHKLNTSNTFERLEQLSEKEVISKTAYNNIIYSYNFLMQYRLKHQVECLMNNVPVDNIINSQNISELDNTILKKIFSLLEEYKNKIRLDFKGSLAR
ncbi:MAG: DUF294 nucleotidyltransferase-like domain-containing protein [bacterium]